MVMVRVIVIPVLSLPWRKSCYGDRVYLSPDAARNMSDGNVSNTTTGSVNRYLENSNISNTNNSNIQ